jgi:hypothetical protein
MTFGQENREWRVENRQKQSIDAMEVMTVQPFLLPGRALKVVWS